MLRRDKQKVCIGKPKYESKDADRDKGKSKAEEEGDQWNPNCFTA